MELQAYRNEVSVFRSFKEFRRGRHSIRDKEYTGTAVVPENLLLIRKMLIDDNSFV